MRELSCLQLGVRGKWRMLCRGGMQRLHQRSLGQFLQRRAGDVKEPQGITSAFNSCRWAGVRPARREPPKVAAILLAPLEEGGHCRLTYASWFAHGLPPAPHPPLPHRQSALYGGVCTNAKSRGNAPWYGDCINCLHPLSGSALFGRYLSEEGTALA